MKRQGCHGNSVEHRREPSLAIASCRCDRIAPLCSSCQALWEQCVYDPRSGQLLSGSLLDYALPRADLLLGFDTEISEVPSTTNPLSMRGGSEGGITPGLAAVANAVVDALAEFGIEYIELPATPERIWNAIRAARRDAAELNRPAAKLTSLASACRHALSVS